MDCDGVVVDIEMSLQLESFNRVWSEEGITWQWTPTQYRDSLSVAGGHQRLLALANSPEFRAAVDPLTALGDWFEVTKRWHARKTEILGDLLLDRGTTPRLGIRRLVVEALCASWRVCVVSSGARASVAAVVRQAIGERLYDQVELVTGEDVANRKPAPDLYLEALRVLNVRRADALSIEDTSDGVRASRSAGICCLVTVTETTIKQLFSGAAAVVTTLGDPGTRADVLESSCGWRPAAEYVTLDDLDRLRRIRAIASTSEHTC